MGSACRTRTTSPRRSATCSVCSPTVLPEINAWGRTADVVPSLYLSWAGATAGALAALAGRGAWGDRLGLLLPTGLFLLMTLGPDQIWLFRWPLRLLEHSWVGLAVCFAVLLSAGLARDHVRRRAEATAAIIASGFFLAWSSTPSDFWAHLLWTTSWAGWSPARWSPSGDAGSAHSRDDRLGPLLITPAQAAVHGWDRTRSPMPSTSGGQQPRPVARGVRPLPGHGLPALDVGR